MLEFLNSYLCKGEDNWSVLKSDFIVIKLSKVSQNEHFNKRFVMQSPFDRLMLIRIDSIVLYISFSIIFDAILFAVTTYSRVMIYFNSLKLSKCRPLRMADIIAAEPIIFYIHMCFVLSIYSTWKAKFAFTIITQT